MLKCNDLQQRRLCSFDITRRACATRPEVFPRWRNDPEQLGDFKANIKENHLSNYEKESRKRCIIKKIYIFAAYSGLLLLLILVRVDFQERESVAGILISVKNMKYGAQVAIPFRQVL